MAFPARAFGQIPDVEIESLFSDVATFKHDTRVAALGLVHSDIRSVTFYKYQKNEVGTRRDSEYPRAIAICRSGCAAGVT